jgi:hypothetical protein
VSAPRALVHGAARVGVRLLGAGVLGAAIGGGARRAQGAMEFGRAATDALHAARDVAARPVWDAAGGLMAALPVHAPQLRLAMAAGAVLSLAMAVSAFAARRRHAEPVAADAPPPAAEPQGVRAARTATRAEAAAFLSQVEAAARAVDRLGVSAPRRAPRRTATPAVVARVGARLAAARAALHTTLRTALTPRPAVAADSSVRALPPRAAHAAARGAARRPALVSPLAESGATRAEIARRTGLSRDAVALSLNLTARQV